MKKLIIIIVAVVIVIGAGLGVIWATNVSKDQSTTADSTDSTSTTQPAASSTRIKLPKQTVGEMADCSTYTFDDLAPVWGVTFTDTDDNRVVELSADGGYQYECDYNQTDSGKGVTFIIEYRNYPSDDAAISAIKDVKSAAKFGDTVYYTYEDLADVGDEAFYWTSANTTVKNQNQQMYVRSGNVVFLLSGVNIDGIGADYKDKLLASYKLKFE